MKKTIFWIGAVILVVGIVMFFYGYSTIENVKALAGIYPLNTYFLIYPHVKQQWDTANLLQPIGLGIFVLGAIVLAYGLWAKKESV